MDHPIRRTVAVLVAGAVTAAGAAVTAAPAAALPTHVSSPAAGEQGSDRLLVEGHRGQDVLQWQQVLNRLFAQGDPARPRIAEDGVFGAQTRRATLDLQAHLGVAQDGVVGPVTRDGAAGTLDAG